MSRLSELLNDLKTWLKQKRCRHNFPPRYEETGRYDGEKLSWNSYYVCSHCDSVIAAEASMYGRREDLLAVLEQEGKGRS